MGYSDDVLGPPKPTAEPAHARSTDGTDPFGEANALDPRTVLQWLGVELDGDNLIKCPGCGADGTNGSVSLVRGGWKCQHAGCSSLGHPRRPGFRTNVDTVCELTSCQPIEAVRSLSEQFGTAAPRPRRSQPRAAPPATPPAPPPEDGPHLIYSDQGGLLPTLHNAAELVRWDPLLKSLGFNAWTHRVVMRAAASDGGSDAADALWSDGDTSRTTARYEAGYRWRGGHKTISRAVNMVAEERSFNPVTDALLALHWDGVPRLDRWLVDHAAADDTPYNRTVFAKWLISSVARQLKPGCKVDHVLVLQGRQGAFKSTFLRILAGADNRFTDQLPSFGNSRDFEEALVGIVIAELSELDHLARAELTAVKAAIVRQSAHCRLAYAERAVDLPRTCVFAGTSNEDEFLADPTGDRRWWPVRVGRIDLDAARADRDQLWAEALYRYQHGEQWYLDEADERLARVEQAARYRIDPWEPWVVSYLPGRQWVCTQELLTDVLKIDAGRVDQTAQNRLVRILKRLGGVRQRRRLAGRLAWGYACPDGGWGAPEDGGESSPVPTTIGPVPPQVGTAQRPSPLAGTGGRNVASGPAGAASGSAGIGKNTGNGQASAETALITTVPTVPTSHIRVLTGGCCGGESDVGDDGSRIVLGRGGIASTVGTPPDRPAVAPEEQSFADWVAGEVGPWDEPDDEGES